MTETKCRFFTIADYKEEECWLRERHRSGWKLVKFTAPGFFTFEKCEPEDVIYRMDYKNNKGSQDYKQMMLDFGWEYVGDCLGWLYFRKPANQIENENEGELFSDNQSRIDMIEKIMKTRLLPLGIIFLCCVIPGFNRSVEYGETGFFLYFWIVMFVIYVYLLGHCGFKLRKLRKETECE